MGVGGDFSHLVRAWSVMRFQAWFGSGGKFSWCPPDQPFRGAPSDVDFEAVILE